MPWGVAAAVVGSAVTGMVASSAQEDAAATAASAQTASSEASIAEQKRQFNEIQALLKPYVDSGASALGLQQNLIGIGGAQKQQELIDALQVSPQFQALQQQGENAILQNASATGGLRGGNVEAALAQFRPQVLSQLIDSQFNKLGSITNLGQASAAGQAAMGQASSNNISNLLGQQGQALAGQALASGQAQANLWGNMGNTIGTVGMLGAMGKFSGGGF